jgi:hypothetical protein
VFVIRTVIFTVVFLLSLNRMQGKGKGLKQIGGHRVIHSQNRELVISVYSFMKEEGESGEVIKFNHIKNVFLELLVCFELL